MHIRTCHVYVKSTDLAKRSGLHLHRQLPEQLVGLPRHRRREVAPHAGQQPLHLRRRGLGCGFFGVWFDVGRRGGRRGLLLLWRHGGLCCGMVGGRAWSESGSAELADLTGY